ncbi:DUF397 domain-containing protein [Kitasatospora sp. NPDC057542]|uniref:DUF397 domain-containing protein n=1 Tax=Streptomycetaceae TaxID=2062 RepID=UPI001CCDB2FD|nr:DUF397 domain-containing protein [Streptomyces sp. LS1784]
MNATMPWFRSSYSDHDDGNCVEVASSPSVVHVRDSKDRTGPTLTFSPEAWSAFLSFASEAQAAPVE